MPFSRFGIASASSRRPVVGTRPTQLLRTSTSRAPCSTAMPTRFPATTFRSRAPTVTLAAPGPTKMPTSFPTATPLLVTPIQLSSIELSTPVSRTSTPATRLAQITLPRTSACAASTTSTPSSLGSAASSRSSPITLPTTSAPVVPPPPITTPWPVCSELLLPAIRLPQPSHAPPTRASAAPPSTATPLSRLGAADRPSARIPIQFASTTARNAAAPSTPIP